MRVESSREAVRLQALSTKTVDRGSVCGIEQVMSEETQLEKALAKLRKQGKKIGEPTTVNGEPGFDVDGVLMTNRQIFQTTEISPETS